MKKQNINGKLTVFYTVAELAKRVGRQPDTIRKMHTRDGLLPEPIARTKSVVVKGKRVLGTRLYSAELVADLEKIIPKVKPGGKGVPEEIRSAIRTAFYKEKERLTQK